MQERKQGMELEGGTLREARRVEHMLKGSQGDILAELLSTMCLTLNAYRRGE